MAVGGGDVVTASAAGSRVRRRDALAPVREALLAAARAEADQILARADETVRDMLRRAREQADGIRQQARDRGAAEADELIAVRRAQAQREARALVLAADRAEYEALREAARNAVLGICDDPDYPDVRRRLAALLRRLLGEGAQVHDAPGGGLVGKAPGRSVDLSFARLADRAVDAVLAEESAERASDSAVVGR